MKRNVKSIVTAVLTAVMCVTLAGCDNRSELEKELDKAVKEIEKGFSESSAGTSSKPDPKPIDPFEGLEVVFEGIAPCVTAELRGKNSNVEYTIDRDRDLKNGDKVTITAKIPSRKADDYILTSDSKEFTVENRPYYIMELSDLTDEDIEMLGGKITALVPDDIIAHAGGGAGSTVNSLDFIGNINLTKSNRNYRLYFVYNANVTFAKAGTTEDYIFAAYFGYVYKDTDGTLVFEEGKPSYASSGDMSLSLNANYVGGAYASVDSLNASLVGFGAERETNIA